jgi:hypothetical protein
MKETYFFTEVILKDSTKIPWIKMENEERRMIGLFLTCDIREGDPGEELEAIDDVLMGREERVILGGDMSYVEVYKEETIIKDLFCDRFPHAVGNICTIDTQEFKEMILIWRQYVLDFRKKYPRKEIEQGETE